LNERLAMVPLEELNDKIYKEVAVLLRQHIHDYDLMLHTLAQLLKVPVTEKLFFGGKTNMLNLPEFHDVDKVRNLLTIIDTEEWISNLRNNSRGIHVKIGS